MATSSTAGFAVCMTSATTYEVEQAIYAAAAARLGWNWSHPHGGYIRGDHLKPERDGSSWDDFPSDVDAEEACDHDGYSTPEAALAFLRGYEEETENG